MIVKVEIKHLILKVILKNKTGIKIIKIVKKISCDRG